MILKQLLGKIITDMGFVTKQQLEKALQRQRKLFEGKPLPERLQRAKLVSEARLAADTDTTSLLGQILTNMGFVTRQQLEEALKEQEKTTEAYKSLESEKLGIGIEISSIVNSTLNLAEVLAIIMRHVNQVTNSVASTLMLLDDKTGELVFSVLTGPKADRLTDIHLPPGKGIAGWVAEHEQPVLVNNAKEDPRFFPEIDKISGLETKSILCVPLKAKTKLIGVLEVINKVDGASFTEGDALLLRIFAHQAAMAIENARLYGELQESECRLEEMLANLDKKNKELKSFVYTVSHDLKAPLVSLEGFASMLLNNYKECLDETGRLYLSRIQANAEKMGLLIQDLLELSRIGRIVSLYESVDVTEIIKEAIETLGIQVSEKMIELVIQDNLPSITCDRLRIKQVFENLISNANKFMDEEKDKPVIEIGFHDKEDFFEFFVKDNGIGIGKEYHEKVFEIFTRLGDVEIEGMGVGLTIAKKIVEIHGGTIWIDSDVGKGTTVSFTLPKTGT